MPFERVTKKRKTTSSPPWSPPEYPKLEDYFCNARETLTRPDFTLHYEYVHEGFSIDWGKSYFIQMSSLAVELEEHGDILFFVTNLNNKLVIVSVERRTEIEHTFPDTLTCHAVNRKRGTQEDFFIAAGLANGEIRVMRLFGTEGYFEHVATLNQENTSGRVNCMTWASIPKQPLSGVKTNPPAARQNFYFVGKQQQPIIPSQLLLVSQLDGYVYFYDLAIKEEEKFDLPSRKSSSRIHQPFIIKRPLKNPIAAWDISNVAVNCMEWTEGGRVFITADANGVIHVLDYMTENLITTFKTYFGGISSLACRGSCIVSGGEDDLVYVWKWEREGPSELLCVAQEHENWVSGVALQPGSENNNTLSFVSVGRNGRLAFWEVNPDTGPSCSPPLEPLTETGKLIAEKPRIIPPPCRLEELKEPIDENLSETSVTKGGEHLEVFSCNLKSLPDDRFLTPYLSYPNDGGALFAIALDDIYLCYVNEHEMKLYRTAIDDPIIQVEDAKVCVDLENDDEKENIPDIEFQPLQSGTQPIQIEVLADEDIVVQENDLDVENKTVEDDKKIVKEYYPPLQEAMEPECDIRMDGEEAGSNSCVSPR